MTGHGKVKALEEKMKLSEILLRCYGCLKPITEGDLRVEGKMSGVIGYFHLDCWKEFLDRHHISDELKENILKLRRKYETLTNLLEQIDSEMHELFVISEDMEFLIPQNQSSTPNCPSCNSDLVQEEGHEFGDPDGEETGIIDHFHCTDCGQDFLKDGTKLVKHSETSLVEKEEK